MAQLYIEGSQIFEALFSINSMSETYEIYFDGSLFNLSIGWRGFNGLRWPPRNNPDLMRGSGKKGAIYGQEKVFNGANNPASSDS